MSLRLLTGLLLLPLLLSPVFAQPPQGRGRPARDRDASLKVDLKEPPAGLIQNPRFFDRSDKPTIPAHYTLTGDAEWVTCSRKGESTDFGISFVSGFDVNSDGKKTGSVSQKVRNFPAGLGKWYRFSFRGLAEPGFAVENNGLWMKVEYSAKNGTNPLDGVKRDLDSLIERDRKDLDINGNFGKNGAAVWRTYVLEFRLPFAEIDTLNLEVGYRGGKANKDAGSEFYVTEFALVPIAAPQEPVTIKKAPEGSPKSLISLGGRWYYEPEGGMTERPETQIVNAKNANRLYYKDGRLSNPFAENMTAWLRPGMMDIKGEYVKEDRFVPDNLVLEFKNGKEMVVHTRNIPNHPTALFPDRFGTRNPHVIQERDMTYRLPLEPVRNPNAVAMDATNSNRALPMGPIGFCVNGVCFFNPYDAGMAEAVNIMDRCCGHPAPDNSYHYHKYPVCVKSPFADDGEAHSPLIGFALDGYPIYGPYVSKHLMAKDDTSNPLDAFNMRKDDERGWHYHVTPGKFPYIIGGFAGTVTGRRR